jgi:excisionase family DNA binding protein
MEELLNVDEIARELNVPISWIYSRTRIKGREGIPHLKLGKYVRFERKRVVEWLEAKQEILPCIP